MCPDTSQGMVDLVIQGEKLVSPERIFPAAIAVNAEKIARDRPPVNQAWRASR
jgi:hypothetical protein